MWISKKKFTNLFEMKQVEHKYKNTLGHSASLMTHTYDNKKLGQDHYVFIKGHRTTLHSSHAKAHKKLLSMGFHPMEK